MKKLMLLVAVVFLGCKGTSTSPEWIAAQPVDRLLIFVRDWPERFVEIDLQRKEGMSTFIMYRPSQPGIPRVLLDSVGPNEQAPDEVIELMNKFDVWALADSNAAGAACSTRTGGWVCKPTVNDYSLVMQVERGGQTRAQRYTRLDETGSSTTARALGDFVFAMMQKRTGGISHGN
jgi:hypothetical protein